MKVLHSFAIFFCFISFPFLSFLTSFLVSREKIYTKVLTYFCQYVLGKRNKGFQDSNSNFLTNTIQYAYLCPQQQYFISIYESENWKIKHKGDTPSWLKPRSRPFFLRIKKTPNVHTLVKWAKNLFRPIAHYTALVRFVKITSSDNLETVFKELPHNFWTKNKLQIKNPSITIIKSLTIRAL